jgi:hypothetical protein
VIFIGEWFVACLIFQVERAAQNKQRNRSTFSRFAPVEFVLFIPAESSSAPASVAKGLFLFGCVHVFI